MKTREQYQAFINEVFAVCEKHGIYMDGGSCSEGISGEILVFDKNDASRYNPFNFAIDEADSGLWPIEIKPTRWVDG